MKNRFPLPRTTCIDSAPEVGHGSGIVTRLGRLVGRSWVVSSPLHRPGRRARGWTIVELLLVLGLLGVAASLALPAWQKQRNAVLSRQAAQEIGTMGAAIEGYALDHRAYPDSLADVQLGGRKDPWGRLYVYYNVDKNGRGGARKDRALNPINTDFDLYSPGVDGQTHRQLGHRDSAHDVIRGNNGRFLGLGASF